MTSTTTKSVYTDASEFGLLVDAPVGPYPMVEAAFAWHERRPPDWRQHVAGGVHPDRPAARFMTVIETSCSAAASRMVCMLSGLTWAFANKHSNGLGSTCVEVPFVEYQRVIRVLRAGSLAGRRMLGESATTRAPAAVALGVWRMAVLLVGRFDATAECLPIQVNTKAGLSMLVGAADVLGLPSSVQRSRGQGTIIRTDRRQILRRLTQIALSSGSTSAPSPSSSDRRTDEQES